MSNTNSHWESQAPHWRLAPHSRADGTDAVARSPRYSLRNSCGYTIPAEVMNIIIEYVAQMCHMEMVKSMQIDFRYHRTMQNKYDEHGRSNYYNPWFFHIGGEHYNYKPGTYNTLLWIIKKRQLSCSDYCIGKVKPFLDFHHWGVRRGRYFP